MTPVPQSSPSLPCGDIGNHHADQIAEMAAMRCQHARVDTERVAQVEAQAALVRHRLAVVMEHCAEVDVHQRANRAQPPPPQPRLASL